MKMKQQPTSDQKTQNKSITLVLRIMCLSTRGHYLLCRTEATNEHPRYSVQPLLRVTGHALKQ